MKHFLLVLLTVVNLHTAYAQPNEWSVQLGSGLFSFRGSGAVSQTGIAIGSPGLVNPYGRNSGLSYGLTGQWQHVDQTGLILGIQAGYESLTSRTSILYISGDFTSNPANGIVRLRNTYVNLYPFVGKRVGTKRAGLDITAGIDLASGLASIGSISLEGDNLLKDYVSAIDYSMPTVDIRPRVNLTGYYRTVGLSAGYSLGVLSYTPSSRSDATQVYSQYWRAGVTYRFNPRG
jgi:hypothetical protein